MLGPSGRHRALMASTRCVSGKTQCVSGNETLRTNPRFDTRDPLPEPRTHYPERILQLEGFMVISKRHAGSASPGTPRRKPARTLDHHPIRIVPLHVPGAMAEALAAPHLTYRNGPLIAAAQVFTLFWGAAWKQTAQAPLI